MNGMRQAIIRQHGMLIAHKVAARASYPAQGLQT